MKYKSTSFLLLLYILKTNVALACPDEILRLKTSHLPGKITLCQVYDRYHAAMKSLKAQGVVDPERIADLHAPRMINLPDWQRQKVAVNYDPYAVYAPVPQTWVSWEQGAEVMKANYGKPLNLESILLVHRKTFEGLRGNAGIYRTHLEIGKSLSKAVANTAEAIEAMRTSEYKQILNPELPLLSWTPTDCIEDRPTDFQKQFTARFLLGGTFQVGEWPAKPPEDFFIDHTGQKRQCGFIQYAPPEEVLPQMDRWIRFVNNSSSAIHSPATYFFDPLWAASRVQRWFISIHPFDDGNGRVSRFMMEHVVRSLGLPSPILNDFNNDIYYNENKWAKEIGRGLVQAVTVAEACAKAPQAPGCQPVPVK